jgi:hypothetical protein
MASDFVLYPGRVLAGGECFAQDTVEEEWFHPKNLTTKRTKDTKRNQSRLELGAGCPGY